jgi:hypothetical protein
MSRDDDEFYQSARERLFPKLKGSVLSITIAGDPDPKLCLELGASILFDKPIIVLVPPGYKVPANLTRVASAIVEGDAQDGATKQRLQDAIERVLANDSRTKGALQ